MNANVDEGIYALISDYSGIERGGLNAAQLLEAELGFDSVRIFALCNNVLSILPEEAYSRLEAATPGQEISRKMLGLQTVGDLLAFFGGGGSATEPPGTPAAQP